AAVPDRRLRALPAYGPGGDHARARRWRPVRAGAAGGVAGGAVLDPGRVRRAGGGGRGGGGPRGRRGGGAVHHGHHVRGVTAVAVPVLADARLHGAGDRLDAEPARRGAGGGAVAHPGRGEGRGGAAAAAGVDRPPDHHGLARAGVTWSATPALAGRLSW